MQQKGGEKSRENEPSKTRQIFGRNQIKSSLELGDVPTWDINWDKELHLNDIDDDFFYFE